MEKEYLHQELEVAQAGADQKEGSRGSRTAKVLTTSFFSFSILLTIGAVAFTIIFFISEVFGPSMMTVLNASYPQDKTARDNVLVNKYMHAKPGDVIIVRHYWLDEHGKANPQYNEHEVLEDMSYFIKRLIAEEGDRVRFNRYIAGATDLCESPDCMHYFDENSGEHVCKDISCDHTHLFKLVVNGNERKEFKSEGGYLNDTKWGIMAYYGDNIYNYLEFGHRPRTTNFVPFRDRSVQQNSDGKWEIVVGQGEVFFMGDNRGGDILDDFIHFHSYDGTAFGPQPRSRIEGVQVDKIAHNESFPAYIWRKITDFFSFRWLF